MAKVRYVDEVLDETEGIVVREGYSRWDCDSCGHEVQRYRGESDVSCPTTSCGANYNAAGQRLRDDWKANPSWSDDEIGDLEGYERQHAGDW